MAVLYLLAALFVRSWFLAPLFSSLKQLEKPIHKELKKVYLKKSLVGWVFFLLPLVIFLFLWQNEAVPIRVDDSIWISAGVGSFFFSIILHLIAFGLASVVTLKKTSETQEKKLFEA